MDGSAAPFVYLLRSAGIQPQPAARPVLRLRRPLEVRDGERHIRIEPARSFRVSYAVEFDHPVDRAPGVPRRFPRSRALRTRDLRGANLRLPAGGARPLALGVRARRLAGQHGGARRRGCREPRRAALARRVRPAQGARPVRRPRASGNADPGARPRRARRALAAPEAGRGDRRESRRLAYRRFRVTGQRASTRAARTSRAPLVGVARLRQPARKAAEPRLLPAVVSRSSRWSSRASRAEATRSLNSTPIPAAPTASPDGRWAQATVPSISWRTSLPGSRKASLIAEPSGSGCSVSMNSPPAPSVVAVSQQSPASERYSTRTRTVRRRKRRRSGRSCSLTPRLPGSQALQPGPHDAPQQRTRLRIGGDVGRQVGALRQIQDGVVGLFADQHGERGAQIAAGLVEGDGGRQGADLGAPRGEVDLPRSPPGTRLPGCAAGAGARAGGSPRTCR